jgi:hypothetical protein
MNREYDKEKTLACIQVMQAYVDGKTIQFLSSDNEWLDFKPTERLSWDWFKHTYRIKPEPTKKKLPLTQEDIPPVCWLKGGLNEPASVQVYEINNTGLTYLYLVSDGRVIGRQVTYQELSNGFYYSADRKNWKPCYKEVEE